MTRIVFMVLGWLMILASVWMGTFSIMNDRIDRKDVFRISIFLMAGIGILLKTLKS